MRETSLPYRPLQGNNAQGPLQGRCRAIAGTSHGRYTTVTRPLHDRDLHAVRAHERVELIERVHAVAVGIRLLEQL